jgi:RNA polymerase sigma factor (TIGR02999 family)
MPEPNQAARLFALAGQGDASAAHALFDLLSSELRALAADLMRSERPDHTLQPTALVHEAWLRLSSGEGDSSFVDRAHFLRTAGRVMRHVLVDHARGRVALKRGAGARPEPLDVTLRALEGPDRVEILALDEALERLSEIDDAAARVVELRFFAGLAHGEVAEALGLSIPTVERHWRFARLWLSRCIGASEREHRTP